MIRGIGSEAMGHRTIGFVWDHFGAYHMDRLVAVADHFANRVEVSGIEIASTSDHYRWESTGTSSAFRKITLFPDRNSTHISEWRKGIALIRVVRQQKIEILFIANYESASRILLALYARVTRRRLFVMNDSKFDDKPRSLWREVVKRWCMLPYHGAFASGNRARDYLYFQGFDTKMIVEGYDTVSLARLRALVGEAPPVAWIKRPFVVVARLMPKKNLHFGLEAYRRYLDYAGEDARPLLVCGDGPLRHELGEVVEMLGLSQRVEFRGSCTQQQLATILAGALCLLLPSYEEQWGLVVNEALAFALPVLVSDAVGARDSLVSTLRNGFVLPVNDAEAWTAAMLLVGSDEALWQRLQDGAEAMAPRADVARFVDGCETLIRL